MGHYFLGIQCVELKSKRCILYGNSFFFEVRIRIRFFLLEGQNRIRFFRNWETHRERIPISVSVGKTHLDPQLWLAHMITGERKVLFSVFSFLEGKLLYEH